MQNIVEFSEIRGFNGKSRVRMEDDSEKFVSELKKGELVMGGFKVKAVIKTLVDKPIECVDINSLLISPWHPIFVDADWVYPGKSFLTRTTHVDVLYNVVLEFGSVIILNNIHTITLGHNLSSNNFLNNDVFKTEDSLSIFKKMPGWDLGEVVITEPIMIGNLENQKDLK